VPCVVYYDLLARQKRIKAAAEAATKCQLRLHEKRRHKAWQGSRGPGGQRARQVGCKVLWSDFGAGIRNALKQSD